MAIANPFGRTVTFAVAPVLNFSGQSGFDPLKAADLLASELSYVQGVSVLPVNRVVSVLAADGKEQIGSPAHALAVARAVGADAIVVAGITEYDPYTPVVGLTLQMYTVPDDFATAQRRGGHAAPAFDPVLASRQARPLAITEMADVLAPTGQIQAVYNGTHRQVVDAVRDYARDRNAAQNPFGWRQYLKVQTLFLRFCWYHAVDRLMEQAWMGSFDAPDPTMLAEGQVWEDPA